MNIKGKIVTLRAIEKSDLELLHKWSNDPEIQYVLGGWHAPSSMANMEDWLKRISSDDRNLRLAIDHPELGLIGMANLVDINWKDKNAFHGLFLGDKASHGKGFGLDVVYATMRYAFEDLGLNRLETTIIEYNEPSKKLFSAKCGWKIEGTQIKWYWRKNKFWNRFLLGITYTDYLELIERNNYWSN